MNMELLGHTLLSRKPAEASWLLVLVATYLIYFIYSRLYSGRLSQLPGPRLRALSILPHARHLVAGTAAREALRLHQQYGEVVRVAPNEVSFTSADTAFPDIYGFRTGARKGRPNMGKDPTWYTKPSNGVSSILQADDANHSRGRRALASAFSDKAVAAQESLIQKYVDQLVTGLKEAGTVRNEPVNIVKWYDWTTFDVIADLMFGEPFGCLQNQATHKWVTLLSESSQSLRYYWVLAHLPWLKYLGNLVVDQAKVAKRVEHQTWVAAQVAKRVEQGETTRPDFISLLLAASDADGGAKGHLALTPAEINSNAFLMLNAGTETTATTLTSATWHLLRHPHTLRQLQAELRARFARYDDITLAGVSAASTPYLGAVVSEALRLMPPAAVGFGRVVPAGGELVSGHFVPEGTVVSVSHYAAYRSERNFKDPDVFVPERWLGDVAYAEDKRNALQPFSYGPRSCLGRNLAYAEARLILAKVFWTFDMEFEDPDEARTWLSRCKVMRFWVKPQLTVRLNSREA